MGDDETTRQTGGELLQLSDKWGDDISDERKAELEERLQAWANATDHGEKRGPFDREELTGADVFWLAARTLAGSNQAQAVEQQKVQLQQAHVDAYTRRAFNLSGLHLERVNLRGAHLEHAVLSEAHFEGADLTAAHLDDTDLTKSHLEQSVLRDAWLESSSFFEAHGMEAVFYQAHMHRANLVQSHFPKAGFAGADLTEATLGGADLRQADFARSDLRGANLPMARLGGADMRRCRMDAHTELKGARLGDKECGFAIVADVLWDDASVSAINWSIEEGIAQVGKANRHVVLGDEVLAYHPPDLGHIKAGLNYGFDTAIRAYRQLAAVLKNQGATEQGDELLYQAQLLRRSVLWRTHQYPSCVGSLLLDLLAGYGFRPGRSILVCLAVIFWFANFYVWASHGLFSLGLPPTHVQPLAWYEGLILSVSSFHGRGFQPFQNLNDPIAALAGMQAVFGLIIEVSFIATFTQRFFAR